MTDQAIPLQFYTDTHIAKAVAVQLRSRGVDAIRCEEVGLAEIDDVSHLEYASRHGRAMVSHDRDFLMHDVRWRASGKSHMGIFFVQPYLQGNIGQIVKELYTYYELIAQGAGTIEDDIANRVLYIG